MDTPGKGRLLAGSLQCTTRDGGGQEREDARDRQGMATERLDGDLYIRTSRNPRTRGTAQRHTASDSARPPGCAGLSLDFSLPRPCSDALSILFACTDAFPDDAVFFGEDIDGVGTALASPAPLCRCELDCAPMRVEIRR